LVQRRIAAPLGLALLGCAIGCSAGDNGSKFPGNSSQTATTGGLATTVGAGGATGSGTGRPTTGAAGNGIITLDASVGSGGGGGGGPENADAACAVGCAAATLSPVNMFVTFDKSGSMAQNMKWTNATAAFTSFFEDPGTAGLRVAFRYFPDSLPVTGCDDQGCSLDACSQPLVPLAPLLADPAPQDTQEAALVMALKTAMPGGRGGGNGGGTPLYAALGGAEQWAAAYQMAHPDEKTVVILMTDGEPNGCDETIADIAGLAGTSFQNNKILTYAIGLQGSAQAQMDQIAMAGGTMNGFFIGAGTTAQTDLLKALTAIRGMSLSCDFPVPPPAPGETLDPTRVNVTFTPSSGAVFTLGQVPDMASCGMGASWFYDIPATPSRIFLCPGACDMVRADMSAKLDILFGCKTVIGPPK
jgi:Mg-chelatase subunit ChlD